MLSGFFISAQTVENYLKVNIGRVRNSQISPTSGIVGLKSSLKSDRVTNIMITGTKVHLLNRFLQISNSLIIHTSG